MGVGDWTGDVVQVLIVVNRLLIDNQPASLESPLHLVDHRKQIINGDTVGRGDRVTRCRI